MEMDRQIITMKYKGFILEPSYYVGSTFRINKLGQTIPRTPTKSDIEYWEIYDPMEKRRHGAETTIKECKDRIDDLLKQLGMADNTPESWKKLET
jgi:protein-tyrosine-phosphatase